MTTLPLRWIAAAFLAAPPQTGFAADSGLITMPSKYPVETTIYRFEEAIRVRSDQGWRNWITLPRPKRAD